MIELDEARELLKKAVETKGREFQYAPKHMGGVGCFYAPRPDLFSEDDPRATTGCVAGVALSLAGVEFDPGNGDAIDNLAPEIGLSYKAGAYLRAAQRVQDNGLTWGEAYDVAEGWLDRLAGGKEAAEDWLAGRVRGDE